MAADPAQSVRHLVLSELDPARGACTVLRAHLVDTEVDTEVDTDVTPHDVMDLVGTAVDEGEVPIGPFEYAEGDVEHALHDTLPVASMSSVARGVTVLQVALALGPQGWLAVGGSRYGHLSHTDQVYPGSAVLLPDVEAGLAELAVYTRRRARQLGYRGRVAVDMETVCEMSLILFAVNPVTGGITDGVEAARSPVLRFEYSLDMAPEQIEALHFEAAARLALAYGVDEPQWYTREAAALVD